MIGSSIRPLELALPQLSNPQKKANSKKPTGLGLKSCEADIIYPPHLTDGKPLKVVRIKIESLLSVLINK